MHNYNQFYCYSYDEILQEREKHIKTYWFIIHPFSLFTKYWQVLMVFVWLFILANDCFLVTFIHNLKKEGHPIVEWYIITHYTCIILLIDVLVTCLTGYIDIETKSVVLNPWRILFHYSRTWCIIDSITLFAFFKEVLEIKLCRFLRILYLYIRLLRLTKLAYISTHIKWITDKYKLTYNQYLLVCIFIISFYIMHVSACTYVFIPNSIRQMGKKLNISQEISWVQRTRQIYQEKNIEFRTIYIYYWSMMQSIARFNFGAVIIFKPRRTDELILGMLFITLCYVVKVVTLYLLYSVLKTSYKSSLHFDIYESKLQSFLQLLKIPNHLQKKIIYYLNLRYANHIISDKIVKDLSPSLQLEVSQQDSKDEIERSFLFKDMPKNIFEEISAQFELDVFIPNAVIFEYGDEADCIYYLSSGTIALYNKNGREEVHIVDGQYFGLTAAYTHTSNPIRMYRAVTIEYCEVLVLTRELLQYYSLHYSMFRDLLDGLKDQELSYSHI